MKFHIRFVDNEVGEYEGTAAEIEQGFKQGYYKFTRFGYIEYIPVGAVKCISVASDAVASRGFTGK
jgi:hypothetical protein